MISDLEELDQIDPKYLPADQLETAAESFEEKIAALPYTVYLQPNDPWMMTDTTLIRLPFPPAGEGLSMKVSALPVVRALGGTFRRSIDTRDWELVRLDPEKNEKSENESPAEDPPELLLLTMTLGDILIPLKMGILLLENGSVCIGERKRLESLGLPDLGEKCRLILHPFRDEALFTDDFYTDEWGYKRRRYNQELAIRSLAFSKASYNMRIVPFITDGWLDYTLIYEGKIRARADDWNIAPSGRKILMSSVRQLIASQSAKAVVMGRPTSRHTAVINITFTGTKHAADWLNNIKVGVSNQLHRGFYELASQFDSLTDQIHLSLLARTMGLEDLTLTEVFQEAARPDSRFKIWITGHSQECCTKTFSDMPLPALLSRRQITARIPPIFPSLTSTAPTISHRGSEALSAWEWI